MKPVLLIILTIFSCAAFAQQPTLVLDTTAKAINGAKPISRKEILPVKPAVAIRRSAILPGWGQVTNKSYWKVPVVYAALGTTGYIFFRNLKQFRDARDAYKLATDNDVTNDYLIKQPYFTVKDNPGRIKTFRDQVRQNIDYAALVFIVFWGLNVVDAAVDAHLKNFDVSDDLSFHIKAGSSEMARTTGISLVLSVK